MNPSEIDRRTFLATSAAAVPLMPALAHAQARQNQSGNRAIAISSQNGLRTVAKAIELIQQNVDPLEAVVAGINIVENDPEDMSVGYGGLPNERGIVELDSSVMHGPTHKAGAVAALRNIRNPASVALKVLQRTDHVLLVGKGALEFAKAHGFQEENLLTEEARKVWLKWKENLNPNDDWLDDKQTIPHSHGTIHCSAVDSAGNIGSCTSTSGLSFKIPGRVGDSPLIGAGMFCDNEVGAAGATGRGEAAIQSCGSFQVVQNMANGLSPKDACLRVLQWVADHTKRRDLLDDTGRPKFQLTFYALRKDGQYGSAAMYSGKKFTVHDGNEAREEDCASLFD